MHLLRHSPAFSTSDEMLSQARPDLGAQLPGLGHHIGDDRQVAVNLVPQAQPAGMDATGIVKNKGRR